MSSTSTTSNRFNNKTMKKLLIVSPHFSTGGAPQVTLNKVELLKDHFDIVVVEYAFLAWNYVVQRNKVIDILGDNFKSLSENKMELLDIIEEFNLMLSLWKSFLKCLWMILLQEHYMISIESMIL